MELNVQRFLDFLNTWYISNTLRQETELLTSDSELAAFMKKHFHIEKAEPLEEVIKFRNDTRELIQSRTFTKLNQVFSEKITFEIKDENHKYTLEPRAVSESFIGNLTVILVKLAQDQQLHRLKMCPDCQYVFFDSSRSGTKKWCSMTKQSKSGRACGTISKVRTYREKTN
ncbi:CGNR zinc finger domain-containing protein [Jeotgalibacillus salarius]|uniref:CGNR zinc finger domain-containing protein n=1 Tax=Jeotgalibacillus salarius TaxID=546023 RepID=A0A4Y8LI24_9BACL|nr:CGNR zinc finger domain-containing protein [Jeotgalibacillus salarius]TFE02394.1 CGNR zinc finger domain-containing protein [Jeotgalibacillus salarius]